MKKRPTAVSKHDPVGSKSKGLQQEAADMEAKLMELRKAMEAERARRENIMSSAATGSLWQNGGTGLLRSNFRNKQGPGPAAAVPGKPAAVPSTSSPASRTGSASAARADMPGRAAAGAQAADTGQSARSEQARTPPQVSVVGNAAARRAAPDVLSVHQDKPAASPGGFACGTDGNEDLSAGAFNEADSHRSFLDALNEWRSAQRGAAAQSSGTETSRVMAAQPGASMEVQTDTASKTARPQFSKKSYFEKLALNSASRQAGQSATGVLEGAEGSASRGDASPSSSGAQPKPVSSTPASHQEAPLKAEASTLEQRLALLDRLEQLEQKLEQRADDPFEDEEDGIVVTTANTVGLVKGVHLPDAILLPDHAVDAEQ